MISKTALNTPKKKKIRIYSDRIMNNEAIISMRKEKNFE